MKHKKTLISLITPLLLSSNIAFSQEYMPTNPNEYENQYEKSILINPNKKKENIPPKLNILYGKVGISNNSNYQQPKELRSIFEENNNSISIKWDLF